MFNHVPEFNSRMYKNKLLHIPAKVRSHTALQQAEQKEPSLPSPAKKKEQELTLDRYTVELSKAITALKQYHSSRDLSVYPQASNHPPR